MAWKVFAGHESDILCSLVIHRAFQDGLNDDRESINTCLKSHIHRGLSYIASGKDTRSITNFLAKW